MWCGLSFSHALHQVDEAKKGKHSRFTGALGISKDIEISSIGADLDVEKVRTKVVEQNQNPEFNEVFQLPFSEKQRSTWCANLEVMDADSELKLEGADDFLGAIEIDLMDLGVGVVSKKSHTLLGVKKGEIMVETFVSTVCAETNLVIFATANMMRRPILVLSSDEDMIVHGSGYFGSSGVFAPYR